MSFLTRIKSWGIQVADAYTHLANRYQDLRRPFMPKTQRTLEEREAECYADMDAFWRFNEIMIHRIPQPMGAGLDKGDQAIWHGIYTAMLAMKYALDASDELAYRIERAVEGLRQHQMFHMEQKPRLIRGYDRMDGSWEDDASNDSLTGHLAGIYFAYRYGPASTRGKCMELLANITRSLLDNNLQLVKADGTPTKHGKLISGAATDPLQMTLVLAILTFAENRAFDHRVSEARHEIYTKYGAMIPYPKVAFGGWEKWNDEHRAAIHLAILALEDKSPRMHRRVVAGLRRLWGLCERRGNVWVNALIALGLGNELPSGWKNEMSRQAGMLLSEYELTDKRWDTEVVNGGKTLVGINGSSWEVKTWQDGKYLRAFQPLPAWACGKQDFIWQRNRYSCNDWLGAVQPSSQYNGGDFLAAYWLSRITGILSLP